jgi:hypothetical protein
LIPAISAAGVARAMHVLASVTSAGSGIPLVLEE